MNYQFFNDKYSHVKIRRQFHSYNIFDLESEGGYVGGMEGITRSWNELKDKLKSGEISIDSFEDIPNTPFLGVLNKALSYEFAQQRVKVDIFYYSKNKKFYRAAIIKPNEIIDTSRFIPRADMMRGGNRFSPKGIEWLYMGVDRYGLDAKKCCFAEVRANEASSVKYCEFKCNLEKNDIVIDLTISDGKDLDDICRVSRRKPEKNGQIFVIELFMKLLSEEIFKPIETNNKDIEYAPFQFMGNYFKRIGYKGIIYKSTVSSCGKNIVIFNKNSYIPQNIIT